MSEKLGIENLKELSSLILRTANGVSASLKDGEVSWKDALNFKEAVFAILPAIKGISEVDDEYFDLDDAEVVELKAFIAKELQLDPSHENIEMVVESVMSIVISFNEILGVIVGVKSTPEASEEVKPESEV